MNPNLQLTIVAELMSIRGVLVMSIIILVIGCLDKKAIDYSCFFDFNNSFISFKRLISSLKATIISSFLLFSSFS